MAKGLLLVDLGGGTDVVMVRERERIYWRWLYPRKRKDALPDFGPDRSFHPLECELGRKKVTPASPNVR